MRFLSFPWIATGTLALLLVLTTTIFGVEAYVTLSAADAGPGDATPSPTTKSSMVTTTTPEDDDGVVLDSNETFFDGNETVVPFWETPASDLSLLLQRHNLTTVVIAKMFLGTYFPQNPRDSDNHDPGLYWKAQIVTPVEQGVNGSLVQAVLYSNEYRNPENPQRVLSFAGVKTDNLAKTASPESACLAALYGFKGTDAEGDWLHTCVQNGYLVPNMTEWGAQVGALVKSTNATFLTGHRLGCELAKSEGLLNPHLPVVCWSATGSLTEAWIDAYPGLSDAIRRTFDTARTNQTTSINNNNNTDDENNDNTSTETSNSCVYVPENDQIYVIQTLTDPISNCLLPPETPGTGLAHVCAYGVIARCDDPSNGFDYGIFSRCIEASLTLALFQNLPEIFESHDCISREDVGIDFSLRNCPFQQIAYDVPDDDYSNSTDNANATSNATTETTSGGPSFMSDKAWMLQTSVSFLFTAIVFLQ
jgi:hypothetical protein